MQTCLIAQTVIKLILTEKISQRYPKKLNFPSFIMSAAKN